MEWFRHFDCIGSPNYVASLRCQVSGLLLEEGRDMKAHLAKFEALMLQANASGLHVKDAAGDPWVDLFLTSLPMSLRILRVEFRSLPPVRQVWLSLREIYHSHATMLEVEQNTRSAAVADQHRH